MTHEDAFLDDIVTHPDDDTPRRIFADWMFDQNDPVLAARAELIHLQCDLARLPPGAARPATLVRRERYLLEQHGREWGSPFQRLGCTCWEYRRGFVEGVGMSVPALLAGARTLFQTAPIRELKLYGAAGHLAALARCPYLLRLRALDLEGNDLTDTDLKLLAGSPNLNGLTTLLLWNNRIADAGLAALALADLPRLTRLDLSRNAVGDVGVTVLAGSSLIGRLNLLDLTGNQVGDRGAVALAASPRAATLRWLDLTKNPIGATGHQALRERFGSRVQVWG